MFLSNPEVNIQEIKVVKKDTNETIIVIQNDDNIDEE